MRSIKEEWKDDAELLKKHAIELVEESVQAQFKSYFFDITHKVDEKHIVKTKQGNKDEPLGLSQITADTGNIKQ